MGIFVACILLGMTLGVGLMLFISWLTYLRRDNVSVWKHLKDLTGRISSTPEYRNR